MKEKNPCSVCGESTRRRLLNDDELRIPLCSCECENKYLDALSEDESAGLLTRFDNRIAQTKYHLRLTWIAAGIGVFVVLMGLLTKTVELFLAGALFATACALLTRYFEERIVKLTGNRKRICV